MTTIKKEDYTNLLSRYKHRLESELGNKIEYVPQKVTTKEYKEFKADYLKKKLGIYEELCNLTEKIVQIKPDEKKSAILQESINISHLNITPTGAVTFSLLMPVVIIIFSALFFFFVFQSFFFIVFFMIVSIIMIKPLGSVPMFIANSWRLKTSNQMVLCIFYVATYMRHTPNLENAIGFAAEHLGPPLALDLKKVLWDVETEKYSTVKESLDAYLDTWKKWNQEFIESFNLIESSLLEGNEERRIHTIDRALEVILEGTYERMLHYTHNLKAPITMLHMLGIILPILGLVILPLVVSFMENVAWYHIATLYNFALPVGVYLLGRNILSTRPTGYGETNIVETNPEFKKFQKVLIRFGKSTIGISPLLIAIIVGLILVFIGIIPIILHAIDFPDMGFGRADSSSPCGFSICLLDYSSKGRAGRDIGPFSIIASLLSLFVTLGIGLGFGIYYRLKSRNVMEIRERSKKLENEFAGALFQLGNRLSDGIPAELAIEKVALNIQGTTSGDFFNLVSMNIRRLGLSLKQAIFDPMYGAILYFPSNLIESSMKVLTESIRKGPVVAAQALINVSRYIKEIDRVNERLKDLMADLISSISTQIKFLTPAISGIVVGITSMISAIIRKLNVIVEAGARGGDDAGNIGIVGGIDFKIGIPTYYFQIIVGIYIVEIIFILTILANGIENGSDNLAENHSLGKNLIKSTLLYVIISFVVMVLFNFLSMQILPNA